MSEVPYVKMFFVERFVLEILLYFFKLSRKSIPLICYVIIIHKLFNYCSYPPRVHCAIFILVKMEHIVGASLSGDVWYIANVHT